MTNYNVIVLQMFGERRSHEQMEKMKSDFSERQLELESKM